MKKIFTLILCLSTLSIYAQKITNFKINQNKGELALHFDITGSEEDLFDVSVFYSEDQQNWNELEKVYGDVGDSIKSGKGKRAVLWISHLQDIKSKMHFKITAEFYTIDTQQNGTLKDKKGIEYNWVRIGKSRWMTENLKTATTEDKCGGYFTSSAARNACPEGWHLPSDKEWMALETNFGTDEQKVNEHGLRDIDLPQLQSAGFTIYPCTYNVSLYPDQMALAFWTSTENKMLYTGYSKKYLSRIIRIDENKISKELRSKSEQLSVRCVQSSVHLAKTETTASVNIELNPVGGVTNHPFTGEELPWLYIGDAIWMKEDILGSYVYKEIDEKCPAGWRIPEKEEWEKLFDVFKPSIELENSQEVLSERLNASGIWGFNLSHNDYWMNSHRYTYNTYWISETDKEDSKKLVAFPTNDKGVAGWEEKQTNEKAKVRCVLNNEDYISAKEQLNTGTFVDQRDDQEYGFIEIDGTIWMSENLNYEIPENSMCRNNILKDCELFGHMYNTEVAEYACPDGFRLPSSDEWKYLLLNKAANNLKILYPFGGTGFNLLLGGELIYDEENKKDIYTANYMLMDEDKPGFYYINSEGTVEFNNKAKRRDFYYIRCVKEN